MQKVQVLNTLKHMPEEFPLADLIDRLLLVEQVTEGLRQVASGQVNTTAQAKQKLSKWLK